jgi:hypothetical protein
MDLSWIGSTNTAYDDDDPSNYSCEFCNVALIEKRDDINDPKYGIENMRWICPRCMNIKDPNYGKAEEIKHRESFRPITEDVKPYAEVLCMNNSDSNDNDNERSSYNNYNDDLDDIEPDEFYNLRSRGHVNINTVTKSSLNGRTIISRE